MTMKKKLILKVVSNLPNDKTQGAGLTCLRPSYGSPFEVHFCSPNSREIPSRYVDNNIKFFDFISVNNILLQNFWVTKRLAQIIDNLFFLLLLLRIYRKDTPEVIICYGMVNFIGCYIFSRLKKIPLIVSFHNITEIKIYKKIKFIKKLLSRCLEIWVCSVELLREIEKDLKIPIFYRPTGYDPEDFYNLKAVDRFEKHNLISVGSFKWKKNLNALIYAISILKKDGIILPLTLIGDGPLKTELKLLVQKLELTDQIIFTGNISQKEILIELNNATIFVLPSYAEGRPKAVIEALATGLPVIASKECNCADILNNAGLILENSTPKIISNAIKELLSNKQKWHLMSDQGLKNVMGSSWEEISNIEQTRINRILSKP